MSSGPVSPSRPQLAVGWVAALLAAPIAVQGVVRLLSAWTGEPHAAALVTAAALVPVLLAGAVALVRGATSPAIAWIVAGVSGAALLGLTAAPVSAIATAAISGWIAARGLPWLAARAPLPRGRVTAVLWTIL